MATTQDILQAASALGKMVSEHESAKRLESAVKLLQNDLESQRLLADFNKLMQTLAQKEASGRPIEVADKRTLEAVQSKIVKNPTLRQFQIAQMDHLDLLRKIDEIVSGGGEVEAPQGNTVGHDVVNRIGPSGGNAGAAGGTGGGAGGFGSIITGPSGGGF